MTSWINVNGGTVVQPAFPSYAAYTIDPSPLVLTWGTFVNNNMQSPVAGVMDLQSTAPNDVVQMPDATLVSQGTQTLIRNLSANTILVENVTGGNIATIPAGQAIFLYLTNNSTPAGTWNNFTFGTGASSADAATLAGLGLIAITGTLNSNTPTNIEAGAYTILPSDRASLQVFTGGTVTWDLPDPTAVTDGYWVAINNVSGVGGLLTINNPYGNIDNSPTLQLIPGASTILICDGNSNFYTLGKGLPATFEVGVDSIDVSGNSNVTLSAAQAQRQFQNLTGTLTGNISVIFPATPYYWFVSNQTTGNFTLSCKIAGGADVFISQGQRLLIGGDGTDLYQYPTASEITEDSIDVSGNTNVTLTGEQAENQILSFTGALTGNISVIFPAVPYYWYISNETTGAFTLSCKTSGGTDVFVTQGERIIIAGDGVDVYEYPTPNTDITNLTYILQTPSLDAPNGQALSALATGILFSTTGTGVVSIAQKDVDYYGPAVSSIEFDPTAFQPIAANGSTYLSANGASTLLVTQGLNYLSLYSDKNNNVAIFPSNANYTPASTNGFSYGTSSSPNTPNTGVFPDNIELVVGGLDSKGESLNLTTTTGTGGMYMDSSAIRPATAAGGIINVTGTDLLFTNSLGAYYLNKYDTLFYQCGNPTATGTVAVGATVYAPLSPGTSLTNILKNSSTITDLYPNATLVFEIPFVAQLINPVPSVQTGLFEFQIYKDDGTTKVQYGGVNGVNAQLTINNYFASATRQYNFFVRVTTLLAPIADPTSTAWGISIQNFSTNLSLEITGSSSPFNAYVSVYPIEA